PHFGGPAWVRKGSATFVASDAIFQKLIELRSDLVRELSKWIDRTVTVSQDLATVPRAMNGTALVPLRWQIAVSATVISVNHFWITFQLSDGKKLSEPLHKLSLSFDHQNNTLAVIVAI